MMASGDNPTSDQRTFFRDHLQFEDVYVPYKEFDHPLHGKVLIGGMKKYSSRVTPPWMLEEGCHRNFAFTMYHADQMPLLTWGALDVRKIGDQLWQVTIEVVNDKRIPTRTAMAAKHNIGKPDIFTCEPNNSSHVATSGTVNSLLKTAKLNVIESEQPNRIVVNGGIAGNDSTLYQFIVDGFGDVTLRYEAEKGGIIEKKVTLQTQFEPKPIEHKRAIPTSE